MTKKREIVRFVLRVLGRRPSNAIVSCSCVLTMTLYSQTLLDLDHAFNYLLETSIRREEFRKTFRATSCVALDDVFP